MSEPLNETERALLEDTDDLREVITNRLLAFLDGEQEQVEGQQ